MSRAGSNCWQTACVNKPKACSCAALNSANNCAKNFSSILGAPLVDGKVESPHLIAKRSTHPRTGWLLATALAATLALGSSLSGPSDLEVMQAIAANAEAVAADKLVLP